MLLDVTVFHADATEAVRWASHDGTGRDAVGYCKGKGWAIYNPRKGCPKGWEPEFICCRPGELPLPVSETALAVLWSMLGLNGEPQ